MVAWPDSQPPKLPGANAPGSGRGAAPAGAPHVALGQNRAHGPDGAHALRPGDARERWRVAHEDEARAAQAEQRRLAALRARGESAYQYIVDTAAQVCRVPIACITMLDDGAVWLMAAVGVPQARLEGSSFTEKVLHHRDVLIVTDAWKDEVLARHPNVVRGHRLRFFAGAPLVSAAGNDIGALIVADRPSRSITPVQARTLHLLARQTVLLLEANGVVH